MDRKLMDVLAEYPNGPGATVAGAQASIRRAEGARSIIMVEGVSDQIAVETLAALQGRDLARERVAVFAVGGSGELRRHLTTYAALRPRPVLAGLCDRDAVGVLARALVAAGVSQPDPDLPALGFHICDPDLETELIRAIGPAEVETIIAAEGEAGALRTLRHQAEWQGRPAQAQLHRFLRSKARRHLRYARLLVQAAWPERVPAPLLAVLAEA